MLFLFFIGHSSCLLFATPGVPRTWCIARRQTFAGAFESSVEPLCTLVIWCRACNRCVGPSFPAIRGINLIFYVCAIIARPCDPTNR